MSDSDDEHMMGCHEDFNVEYPSPEQSPVPSSASASEQSESQAQEQVK